MRSVDILRNIALAGTSLGFLLLPGEAHSYASPLTRSGCLPGDHIVTNEPLFDSSGPNAKTVPMLNTPGQWSGAVLGDVRAPDGSTKIFVARVGGLPQYDKDTRAGFLKPTDSVRIVCTEYEATDYAKESTKFVQAGDVWKEKVVDVRHFTPDRKDAYVIARVDEVLDSKNARVQWVNADGEIVTEVVNQSDLFIQVATPK